MVWYGDHLVHLFYFFIYIIIAIMDTWPFCTYQIII